MPSCQRFTNRSVYSLTIAATVTSVAMLVGGCPWQSGPPQFNGRFSDGKTSVVSVSDSGALANSTVGTAAISADGSAVAFTSISANLVPGDTNLKAGDTITSDVFVHDRGTSTTTRVSVRSDGTQANGTCALGGISGDGNRVVFSSDADNLVAGDTNDTGDVFLRDRTGRRTMRASVNSAGDEANRASDWSAISDDGRFVTFVSDATNLVSDDANGAMDVFRHDVQTGETVRISVSSSGGDADADSGISSLSSDGRYVAFSSKATNLIPNDTNGVQDIFVRDTQSSSTARVSFDTDGSESSVAAYRPSISANGRWVAYIHETSDITIALVHDRDADENGTFDETCSDCTTTREFYRLDDGRRITTVDLSADGTTLAISAFLLGPGLDSDVLIIDVATGTTTRLSADAPGAREATITERANVFGARTFADHTSGATLSSDGRIVAYIANLQGSFTNATEQVFVEVRE